MQRTLILKTKIEKDRNFLSRLTNEHDGLWAIVTVIPSIIAIAVFVYSFIIWNGYVSLSKWKGIIPNYAWRGIQNYIKLFNTQRFQIDLRNMLVFSVVFIGGCLVIGLFLSILLDQNVRGETFFRGVFLFPMAVALVVTGVVWGWLLSPGNQIAGYIGVNQLFEWLNLDFLINGWYTDRTFGIVAVAIAAIWQMSGYVMVMYLTAIRGISISIREAAHIDGANVFQLYRYIIMPNLKAITLGILIILGHISLKVFDLVAAMTGPGKGFATDVPAFFMWDTTFRGNNFNTGAAIGIILLILISFLVVPYLIHLRRSE